MMKKILISAALLTSLMLGACDMNDEGIMTQKKIQVKEDRYLEDRALADVDSIYIATLADTYHRNGEGPLNLTVTYDAQSQTNTAKAATQALSNLTARLKSKNINTIAADILPVHNQGDVSHAIVSFTTYEAKAPEDCGMMPGLDDGIVGRNEDYKLGCSVQALTAKQVANPRDLLGREDKDATTDGRRGANIVDTYRTGVPNKPLQGESASQSE